MQESEEKSGAADVVLLQQPHVRPYVKPDRHLGQ